MVGWIYSIWLNQLVEKDYLLYKLVGGLDWCEASQTHIDIWSLFLIIDALA